MRFSLFLLLFSSKYCLYLATFVQGRPTFAPASAIISLQRTKMVSSGMGPTWRSGKIKSCHSHQPPGARASKQDWMTFLWSEKQLSSVRAWIRSNLAPYVQSSSASSISNRQFGGTLEAINVMLYIERM